MVKVKTYIRRKLLEIQKLVYTFVHGMIVALWMDYY